jgi:alpha-tubulin suppressor-like RCC1 family protein
MKLSSFLLLFAPLFLFLFILSCKEEKPEVASGNAISSDLTLTGIPGATVEKDPSGSTYSFTVPAGTNVKSLIINIPLTSGSKIEPAPGVARDYSSPVTFTITKTDGTKQIVTVKVVVSLAGKSSEKQISTFSFGGLSPAVVAVIDHTTRKITATVPAAADVTKLVPTLTLSPKATVSPASGAVQNFTNPVNYTVTAEDGSKQVYEVKVEKLSSSGNTTFSLIAAGSWHSLLLKSDNSLWASGQNIDGQLGDGSRWIRHTPVKILTGVEVESLSGGLYHSLIVMKDNSLWGMGYSPYLGLNVKGEAPKKIMVNVKKAVAVGGVDPASNTYILKTDNTLWAVGRNIAGVLGDGTFVSRYTPVQVMADVKDVALAEAHGLIVKTDNTLWAVGSNHRGQLGDGTKVDKMRPVKIMSDVKAVSAGDTFSLILKTDNTLWAVGDNRDGQLGDGTDFSKTTPVRVMQDVKAMAAGTFHSLVLKTDNSVWSTGYNFQGQLGDGTQMSRSTFAKVMTDVKAISCGAFYSLALKGDGSLWGFGDGSAGQFGIDVDVLRSKSFVILTPTRLNLP